MKVPFSPPDISEKEIDNVVEILQSGWITTGKPVKDFEDRIAKFLGTNKAVALNSATAALEGALRILGIGEGDEVIVPAYTYTATASPAVHTGATLRMVDVSPDSFEMDYDKLDEIINERTKAIIPVDLGGIVCDYKKIFQIAERKKGIFNPRNELQKKIGRIAIIADGAHAFGSHRDGVMVGNIADFTSFSFHAVKNLTTAEGGALTWRTDLGFDGELIYKNLQLYSLHGQSKDALSKNKAGAWEYDIAYPAYKCNMTNINAAIGMAQLDRYEEMLARRKELNQKYYNILSKYGLKLMDHYTDDMVSTGHLFLVRINGAGEQDRNAVIQDMAEKDIALNVHYKPLPMLSAYRDLGFDIKDYPNAFKQYENLVSLPVFSTMSDEQIDFVIENFISVLKKRGLINA